MNEQEDICKRYGSLFVAAPEECVVGIARNARSDLPVHGLRHPPVGQTSGWYIWSGDYSDADDFFEPVHVAHLDAICPRVKSFLGLAPGWRFLIAENHLDVWYDKTLLAV